MLLFTKDGKTMIYSVENEYLTLQVNDIGAELHSLKSKKTGEEYIWYGTPEIWNGQSPILFPVIGRVLDDKYRLNGKEYTMPKHGIVRRKPFEFYEKTENSLTFVKNANDETKAMYPYDFSLFVKYELLGSALKVSHTVVNNSGDTMLYSFGAHPGFNCQVGDYLEFECNETLETERIEEYLTDKKFPVLNNEKKIVITDTIFENDALIFSGFKSKKISLKSDRHNRSVDFTLECPILGIWAKPGAPYVCLEPWWGIDDTYDRKNDLSQKRGIMELEAGKSRTFCWKAEINE